jgi:hypothetical protein
MTSTELAQVTAHYFAEGETVPNEDDFDFWWEGHRPGRPRGFECFTTEADEHDPPILLCDAVGFKVRAVPSGIGDHTGFIQCELDEMGAADTFDPDEYAPLFKAVADKMRGNDADPVVSFVAVFTCWADRDYWGEYDCGMDYIGYLVLDDGKVSIQAER